jgi:hypothetical protein
MDYDLTGLPPDWRQRVEATVRSVGGVYYLYVTTVKAGARKNPPGILLAVARDGAEDAWTPRVEAVLRTRIRTTLEFAKEEERNREKARVRLEMGDVGASVSEGRIPRETRVPSDPSEKAVRAAKRAVLTGELAALLRRSDLPSEALDLLDVAVERMNHPDRWSLWVRILMQVEEIEEVLPPFMTTRILKLL